MLYLDRPFGACNYKAYIQMLVAACYVVVPKGQERKPERPSTSGLQEVMVQRQDSEVQEHKHSHVSYYSDPFDV